MPALGLRAAAVNKMQRNSETISSRLFIFFFFVLLPRHKEITACSSSLEGWGGGLNANGFVCSEMHLDCAAGGASAESELGFRRGEGRNMGFLLCLWFGTLFLLQARSCCLLC